MRPVTYTADTQKIRGRLVPCAQGVFLGATLALVGVMIGELVPEIRFGAIWALPGLAIVAVSATLAIRLSRHLNAAKNLLSVDRGGMTLVQRGRTRYCRWTDISPVLLQNRFATFTLETGDGRSDGRIDDIYPTPLAEIVARINDCRERASAAEGAISGSQDAEAGPTAPSVFHINSATQTRQRRREVGVLLLSTLFIPLIFFTFGDELLPNVFSDIGLLEVMLAGILAFVLIFVSVITFFASGKSGNFLQVTDEGLTWSRRLTVIRQWRWQDLSSFEVRENRSQSGRAIAFMAADDGRPFSSMGLSSLMLARAASSPGQSHFTLDDTYDAPLDRIAALLNGRREQALADSPPARTIELQPTDPAMAGGRPMNFQQDVQDIGRLGVVGWTLAFGCLVWLPLIVLLGWPMVSDPGWMDGPAQSPMHWLLRFLTMLPMIAIIAEVLILTREIIPADNTIALDRFGLTLTRGGRKKVWAWRDLSDFDVEARKVLGLFGPRGVIVFGGPGGRDLRSRFLRWCYRLTGRAPAIVIEDVYNTPIDAIAETLNRYRSQSAGHGPGAVPAE